MLPALPGPPDSPCDVNVDSGLVTKSILPPVLEPPAARLLLVNVRVVPSEVALAPATIKMLPPLEVLELVFMEREEATVATLPLATIDKSCPENTILLLIDTLPEVLKNVGSPDRFMVPNTRLLVAVVTCAWPAETLTVPVTLPASSVTVPLPEYILSSRDWRSPPATERLAAPANDASRKFIAPGSAESVPSLLSICRSCCKPGPTFMLLRVDVISPLLKILFETRFTLFTA